MKWKNNIKPVKNGSFENCKCRVSFVSHHVINKAGSRLLKSEFRVPVPSTLPSQEA